MEATLLRESGQAEYEIWMGRLNEAKATGPEQLLLEAKNLQISNFVSSEYAARNRSNQDFVEDVFASHLFREPTSSKLNYWVAFMNGLPPSTPKLKRQRRILTEIQALPEFSQVVFGIEDPILSQ